MKFFIIFLTALSISTIIKAQYILKEADVVMKGDTITAYLNETEKDIIIPNEFSGITVKAIGNFAFINKSISSVKFPNTIEFLGDGCFTYNFLTTIELPIALIRIGEYAFQENDLEKITIPKTVQIIGDEAFNLNPIAILLFEAGSNLTFIGDQAFSENKLSSVIFPEKLTSIGEFAFYGNKLSEVTLPVGLLHIGNSSFSFNSLTKIDLPTSVSYIGSFAFSSNPSLSSITLPNLNPNSITKWIDGNNNVYNGGDVVSDLTTFYIIENLYTLTDNDVIVEDGVIVSCNYIGGTAVVIPNTLDGQMIKSIKDGFEESGVFYNYGIVDIQLPSTLESIGDYAFSNNSLTSLTLPQAIMRIGKYAFSNNSLSDLALPSNIKQIDSAAFYRNSIESVLIPNTLSVLNPLAFSFNSLNYIEFENHTSLTQISAAFTQNMLSSITIPKEIESIANMAFYGNRLTNVFFEEGSNLSEIGYLAFWDNSLTNIILPESTPPNNYYFSHWISSDSNIVDSDNIIDVFDVGYKAIYTKGYNVTFNISDGTKGIFGVEINFNNTAMTTDTMGIAIFERIPPRSELDFIVTKKDSFETYMGTVPVKDKDVDISIVLNISKINAVDVSFAKVYPNPNSGNLWIESKLVTAQKIKVFDITGKELIQTNLWGSKCLIDLKQLNAGIYFIEISSLAQKQTFKIYKV